MSNSPGKSKVLNILDKLSYNIQDNTVVKTKRSIKQSKIQ